MSSRRDLASGVSIGARIEGIAGNAGLRKLLYSERLPRQQRVEI